jgi:hypothetical protein
MKKQLRFLSVLGLCMLSQLSYANTAESINQPSKLRELLETPLPTYEYKKEDYQIDKKLYKQDYDVGWRSRPQFNITSQEFKQYKSPVKVKMTVVASTGYIADSQIIKSSGSTQIDKKVKEALTLARLDVIPFVDKSVTYELIHEFDLRNPL